jgi:hypothetical protein
MTEIELLEIIAGCLGDIKELIAMLLAFEIWRVFERSASKKGFF